MLNLGLIKRFITPVIVSLSALLFGACTPTTHPDKLLN